MPSSGSNRLKYPRPGFAGLDPVPLLVVLEWVRLATARAQGPAPIWIVPVPLHRKRLRQRGFNVATLLGREVARVTAARLVTNALIRTRNTPSQTGLTRRARKQNVQGAFAAPLRSPYPSSVWLVDDVVTTTATLQAAAGALAERGVKNIVAICAARTPLNQDVSK